MGAAQREGWAAARRLGAAVGVEGVGGGEHVGKRTWKGGGADGRRAAGGAAWWEVVLWVGADAWGRERGGGGGRAGWGSAAAWGRKVGRVGSWRVGGGVGGDGSVGAGRWSVDGAAAEGWETVGRWTVVGLGPGGWGRAATAAASWTVNGGGEGAGGGSGNAGAVGIVKGSEEARGGRGGRGREGSGSVGAGRGWTPALDDGQRADAPPRHREALARACWVSSPMVLLGSARLRWTRAHFGPLQRPTEWL